MDFILRIFYSIIYSIDPEVQPSTAKNNLPIIYVMQYKTQKQTMLHASSDSELSKVQ